MMEECCAGTRLCCGEADVILEKPGHPPYPLCILCLFEVEPLASALYCIPARGRA